MEGHELGLQGIEFDLGQLAFGDFAPAVDVGFAFDLFAAVEVAQEFAGVIAGSDLAKRWASQGFDSVAAQKLGPVMLEKIVGGEDVTPGDFATVGDDYSDDVLAFHPRSGARKAALHFVDETVDGNAYGAFFIEFRVGLCGGIVGHS